MTDIIFKNMRALSDEQLEGYAKEIGLDVEKWKTDFASEEIKKEVASDLNAARSSGQVRGTPTIFINGRKYQQARSLAGMKPTIDAEIKRADALLKKGITMEKLYEELSKGS